MEFRVNVRFARPGFSDRCYGPYLSKKEVEEDLLKHGWEKEVYLPEGKIRYRLSHDGSDLFFAEIEYFDYLPKNMLPAAV